MTFIEIMHNYFRGERIESLYFVAPAGLLLVCLGVVALKAESGGFAWGLAVPLLVFGLAAGAVGAVVGLRTPGQVAELERALADNPKAMAETELPRMRAVNANWPRLIAAWTVLVLVGLILRFALKADWAHGLGPALILVGAVGFLIDGFAERRARPYTAALEQLTADHRAAPD